MSHSDEWNFSKKQKVFICFVIGCMVAWYVPTYLAPSMETLVMISREKLLGYALFFSLCQVLLIEVLGCHEAGFLNHPVRSFILFLLSALGASTILLMLVWLLEYQFIGRYVVFYLSFFSGGLCFLVHFCLAFLVQKNPRRVLLMVSGQNKNLILESEHSAEEKCHWVEDTNWSTQQGLAQLCLDQGVDLVVVDNEVNASEEELLSVLATGVKIVHITQFWERIFRKIPAQSIGHSWLIQLDLKLRNPFIKRLKRTFDILFGLLGLLVMAPVIFISVVAIYIETGGPVFFRQKRSGFQGRSFVLYKLRTMIADAENGGAKWAKEGDSRITKVGRFLRHWRIDEIPQFWNVIRGEMSLVGPRPERPELEESIMKQVPHWKCRSLIKPGLTGWAQIRFQYAGDLESTEEKLSYDLYYVKNSSIFFDLEIILSTLRSLTQGSR